MLVLSEYRVQSTRRKSAYALSMLQFHPRISASLDFMERVPNSLKIIVLAHELLRGIIRMEGGMCVMFVLTSRKGSGRNILQKVR